MILIKNAVRQYAYNAGFRGNHLEAAVNIAECESGLNTQAYCKDCLGVKEESVGLWQINLNAHPEFKNIDLFDPQQNAIAAYKVYLEAGKSFRPWYNCSNKLGYIGLPFTDEKKSNFAAFAFLGFLFLYST